MLKVNIRHYRVPKSIASQCNKRGPTNILTARLYNRRIGKFSVMLEDDDTPSVRGGVTICEIVEITKQGKEKVVAKGIAYCSMKDAYSYYAGRRLAIDRALGLSKPPNVKSSWNQPVAKAVAEKKEVKPRKRATVEAVLESLEKPPKRTYTRKPKPESIDEIPEVMEENSIEIEFWEEVNPNKGE